jgi:hypothetical protein
MASSRPDLVCPAPRPFGLSPCHARLAPGVPVCPAHVGTDASRICAGMAGPSHDRRPCRAWPLVMRQFCARHDPARRTERQRTSAPPTVVARL